MDAEKEYYFQLNYRPVAIIGIPEHDHAASVGLTEKLCGKIKEIEALVLPMINKNKASRYIINYRIINVTTSVDPRVSTDPGLNSIITTMHVAYWIDRSV